MSQQVPVLDNATTITYANADGTLTAQVYKDAVNYQNAQGNWLPIDPSLSLQRDGSITAGGGPAGLRIAGSLSDPAVVTMTDGAESFTFGTPEQGTRAASGGAFIDGVDAQPVTGKISDNHIVTFADAWNGVDLEYVSSLEQLTQLIVLQAAPTGTGDLVYRFPLTLQGLHVQLTAGGALDLVNAASTVVFEMPAGEMGDSSIDPGSGNDATEPLSYALGPAGQWIDVVASGAWLRDPARQYPVTIDPSVGVNGQGGADAYIQDKNPNTTFSDTWDPGENDYTDWVGYYSSGTGTNETLLYYNLPALAGTSVVSAIWNGWFDWSSSPNCSSTPYYMWRATSGWTQSPPTWNTQPSYSTSDGLSGSVAANWQVCGASFPTGSQVDITSWVQGWASGAYPNDGIVMNENGNGSGDWKKLASYWTVTPNANSYINVTYNPGPGPGLNIPGNGLTIQDPNLSPFLATFGCVGCVDYLFQVSSDSSFSSPLPNPCSAGTSSMVYTVPSGCLLNNQTYWWRVQGSNGYAINGQPVVTNWSGPWSFNTSTGPGPTLASPANGARVVDPNLQPTLSTAGCPYCTQFKFEVSSDPSFQGPTDFSNWQSSTSWQVPANALNSGVPYYWAVEGRNASYVVGNWSATWSFKVSTGPGPSPSSPPNGGVVVDPDLEPTLTTSGCTACTQYDFEISTSATFANGCSSGWVGPDSWQVPAGCLADGQTYYWRAVGETASGVMGKWSATWSFSVAGPVNWGFQDSATNPSPSAQSGYKAFFGPSSTYTPTLPVYVVNQSAAQWTTSGPYEISYHVLNPANQSVVGNGVGASPAPGTTTLPPVPVNQGSGVWVNANVAYLTGLGAGSYELEFDLYDTQSGEWLSQYGALMGNFDILVGTPPAPASPTGGAMIAPGSGGTLQPTLTAGTCTACTGYQFQASTRSDFGAYVTTSPWESSPSWTVPASDLGAGSTFYWRVIGRDQYESSTNWSSSATFVTPATPGAPTAVTATGGAAQVTLNWTAPSNTGGSGITITGYSLVPSLNARPQTLVSLPIGSNKLIHNPNGSYSTNLPSLQNGRSYTFTVAATNIMGIGVPSAPTAAAIPSTVPAAPGGVTAEAGSGQVTVTWQTAVSNGSAVTGYTVTTYAGGTASGTTSAGGSATSAVVSGLGNGVAYAFSVAATNADGLGPASAQTPAAIPGIAPQVSVSLGSSQYARGQTATITATVSPTAVGTGGPTAALSVTPSTGAAPLAVTASASGSTAGTHAISTYTFNFGDGTTVGPQATATAAHTYAKGGVYAATVTVTDTAGLTSRATATEYVGQPAAALAVVPSSGTAPLTVVANGGGSTDPIGISSYTFSFGDGTTVGPQAGATAAHTYAGAGTYTVTLTVKDSSGASATSTATVTVAAASGGTGGPTAALSVTPSTGAAPLAVTASASGSTAGTHAISTYTFNFGDGTTVGPQATATATHTYTKGGVYAATVTVTDTAGLTSRATATEYVGQPAAALAVVPSSGTAPLTVVANGGGSTDPIGISSYTFSFGDGTTVGPQAGATAAHTYAGAGTYTVTLTVKDSSGGSVTTTVSVPASAVGGPETVGLVIPLIGTGFDTTGGTVSVGGARCASAGVTCTVGSSQITISGLSVTSAGLAVVATVRALGSDSVCTQPLVTATVTDATTGRGGLGSTQGSICDGGLGVQQWWTFVGTALGPGGTAEVNAANGNLVVSEQDGGTMQLHGNLSLGIVRAYDSEATVQPGAEPVGLGWITSFVSAGDDLGGVALRVPSAEHVSGGAAITLITDSGARDVFEPSVLATPIDVTTLGTTTGPLGPLVPTTLALGTGYNALCVDDTYAPEAGVHASMWRYVESSTGGCTGLTSANAAVLGYATLTTDGVREEYNASGELLSVRDALGNRVDFTYSGTQLTWVGETGGSGRAYTLTYTTWSGGIQVNITDPAGEVTSYQDNAAGDLVNVLNPSGSSLHYTYGGCGGSATQLCSAQNPDGTTVSFAYQASPFGGPAEISGVTDLLGTQTAYGYGANGAVVNAVTGTEEEHFAQVDALGRVGEVDEGLTTQGAAGVWLHTTLDVWDTSGCQQPDAGPDNELCDILELGLDNGQTPNRETQYTYNDEGAILVQDDLDSPASVVTTTSYLAQYVESNGTVRTFTDTVAGGDAVTSQAGHRQDASTVLVLSDQTGALSPDGNAVISGYASYATTYTRDTNTAVGAGLPIGPTDPCAGAGVNTGLLCTESAPSKDGIHATVTTYTYDQWGQRLSATTPDENDVAQTGNPTKYTYFPDAATDLSGTTHEGGWLEAVTDPTGQFVAYGYDAEGQVIRTWDRDATANVGLSPTTYGGPGTCSSPVAPDFSQTLYATSCTAAPGLYALSQTDALGDVTTYQLDNDGNQLGVRSPRGNPVGALASYPPSYYPMCPTVGKYDTCSTYKAAGEVLTIQQPVEALESGSPHTINTYDAYGNLIQSTDAAGYITTATYDAVNRRVTETVGRYAVGGTLYNAAGSDAVPTGCATSTSAPWPSTGGGEVICTATTTYDGEDNVISVQSPASEVPDVVGPTEPTVTTYVYDGYHRRIETISPRWDGTSRTATSAAVYDPDGNVLESCPANEFAGGSGGCHGPGSGTIDYFSTYTTYNVADLPISVRTYTANTPVTGTPTAAVATTSYDADGNAISTTTADGYTTTNDYNVLDRLVWTGTPQSGNHDVVTWYGYDPSGNKIWTTQTTAVSTGLPVAGALPPWTLSGARDTIVSYDADNRPLDTVVAAKDTTGTPNVCFTNFPSFGVTGATGCTTPLGVTNASGGVNVHTRVSYDADGNQVAAFSADAFQTLATTPSAEYMVRTDYDADDRAVTQYMPRYDTADANEKPLGVTSVFSGQASQALQCPATGSIPAAPGGVGAPQTITGVPGYDTTTGLCITAVLYNGDGQVVEELMPTAGGSWSSPAYDTYLYTDDGLAAQTSAPSPSNAGGRVTISTALDARGKVLVSTDALGNQTTSGYSADGLLLSTTTPPNQSLTLSTLQSPTGLAADPATTIVNAYDAAGDQVSTTDSYGASTLTQYTLDGRKQSVSTPSGTAAETPELTTYTYDAVGNTLTATSPNGYPTAYTYSDNNLLLSTVTPPGAGGASPAYEIDDSYDALGETVSDHTYEVGGTTCGAVGAAPSAACDGGAISESHYLDGRLQTETPETATGDTVATPADTFTYDASGNEIGATNVVSGGTSGATDTMTYYLNGSLRSVDDGAGDAQISGDGGPTMAGYATDLSYDGAGSIATLTLNRDGSSQTSTEALAYNAAEDAVSLGTTAASGLTETRTYTADGQLANQIQTNSDATTYTYNPNGSVQQVWLCGSTSSPTGTCGSGSNEILDWWAYSYNSDGQQSASEAGLYQNNTILEDGYYPDGRVADYTTASGQSTTSGQYTSVNYDSDGNRINVTPGGAPSTTYTYNPNDSLSSTSTTGSSLADSYDADGRLLSDGCSSYTYDGFNQTYQDQTLSSPPAACGSTTTAASTTVTTYDALGRTLTSDQTQSGATTTFWVDHYANTGSLLALLQKDTSTSGAGENDLTLMVGSSGTPSQVISSTSGSQWYTNDGQGDVGAVTGSATNGAAVCVLKYDIYGSPVQPTSSTNPCVGQTSTSPSPSLTEFGYQFAQRDPTTGDYTFGSRQYDPTKAAFTTPDTFQPGSTAQDVSIGTDPLTEDSYSYANADPINLKDPTGHCANGMPSGLYGSCSTTTTTSSGGGGGGQGSSASGNTCGNSAGCQGEQQVANNYYQQQQQQVVSQLAANSAQAVAASSGCGGGCQSEMQVYAAATPVFTAAYDYQQAQQNQQATLSAMIVSSQAQYGQQQLQLAAATTAAADVQQIGAYYASLTSCQGFCVLGQVASNDWTSLQQTFHPSLAGEVAHGLPPPNWGQLGSDLLQLGLLTIPVGGEAADAALEGVSLSLSYKAGWSAEQIAAADAKVASLNSAAMQGQLSVAQAIRSGTSAASMWRAAGGVIPAGADVDHIVDLQLGGPDALSNLNPLDLSVNRSLGAQIGCQTRGLAVGTQITGVSIC